MKHDTARSLSVEAGKLAAFLNVFPAGCELPTHIDIMRGAEVKWLIFGEGDGQKARAAAIVKAFGGHWDKYTGSGPLFDFKSTHPTGVEMEIVVNREQVCRRVSTGFTTVTTPAQPGTPELTEQVETFEFVCDEPLLAGASA